MPAPKTSGGKSLIEVLNAAAPERKAINTISLDVYYRSADLLRKQVRPAPRTSLFFHSAAVLVLLRLPARPPASGFLAPAHNTS
jgi:hypothetical protein